MPIKPRPRREPTDDWQQLDLWVEDPAQRVYEVMRPCVLGRVVLLCVLRPVVRAPMQPAPPSVWPADAFRRAVGALGACGIPACGDHIRVTPILSPAGAARGRRQRPGR